MNAPELIVAVATAPGQGGIGVVRLSGRDALTVGAALAGRALPSRQATYCVVKDDTGVIDAGLILAFPGPDSFTGEDVVELQMHGSPVVLQMIVQRACELGARLARPGEFSERAFLNDKMDLAQAEAVADLIASGSTRAARAAVRSLQGEFSRHIHELSAQLEQLRILVEASIDFPEEEEDFLQGQRVGDKVAALQVQLTHVLDTAQQGRLIKEGANVAILGPPNAGKSSLLNALSGEDAAIVADIPGTTRDLLKVDFVVNGLPVRLVDTAGLRATDDVVEAQGVARAKSQAQQADVLLLVTDMSAALPLAQQAMQTLQHAEIQVDDPRLLRVANKTDIASQAAAADFLAVSAKQATGLNELKNALCEKAGLHDSQVEVPFMARARHVAQLQQALEHLQAAADNLRQGHSAELIAEEMRCAHLALGEIVGVVTPDDLLGKIFSQFCIGK